MAGVLLIGNLRSSLTLARQLNRAGHAVYCGVDELDPFVHASRAVRGHFVHAPTDRAPARALDQIEAWLKDHPQVTALIPVSEIAARLFSRNRARFEPALRLVLPPEAVLETCIDKPLMFDLCDEVGLPVAPRRLPTDQASLFTAIEEIGFPCVVKPADAGHFLFERKAMIFKTMEEARKALPFWPKEHARLCVQKFVDAPRHILMFAARNGQILGAVDAQVTRTDLADGTGFTTRMVSAKVNHVAANGLARLVQRLNYTGVGDVDIMVDERSGEISFLELNPRLGASFKGAEICGLPLSRLILELALDQPTSVCAKPFSHAIGRRLVWTKAEVGALKRDLRNGTLGPVQALGRIADLLVSAATWHHMSFDLRDPMPTAWAYLHPLLHRLGLFKAERLAAERERERFAGYDSVPEREPSLRPGSEAAVYLPG